MLGDKLSKSFRNGKMCIDFYFGSVGDPLEMS